MIRSYSLATSEVDDLETAIREIREQVGAVSLHTHSVGIVTCHYDFINNGIIQAMGAALPFPIVGITSFYQVTPQVRGLFELSITVLTSDDVRFAVAGSDREANAGKAPDKIVQDTYQSAYVLHGESPSLLLSFLSANRPMVTARPCSLKPSSRPK